MSIQRKQISDSVRWSVFARDGFTCRYCGRQAGQDGVTLAVDHVISVAEGGDNRLDNLVTACRSCNCGKAAKSLPNAPTTDDVQARIAKNAEAIRAQADAMAAAIEAEREAEQSIINLKCEAYGVQSTRFNRGEIATARNLIREFGADVVLTWYRAAHDRRVSDWNAIKYVCGIARKVRDQ